MTKPIDPPSSSSAWSVPYIVARRYVGGSVPVRVNRTRAIGFGLSFMTWISILGVAVGVAALIVVLSVMAGFEQNLVTKMLNGEPHLEIFAKDRDVGFRESDMVSEDFVKVSPDIVSAGYFTKNDIILKNKEAFQTAELVGVKTSQPETLDLWPLSQETLEGHFALLLPRNLWRLGGNSSDLEIVVGEHKVVFDNPFTMRIVSEKRKNHPGVIIGSGLSSTLNLGIGDDLLMIDPKLISQGGDIFSLPSAMRRYVVVGIFNVGDPKFDARMAMVDISEGRFFMEDYSPEIHAEKFVTGIGMLLKDPLKVSKVADQLRKHLPEGLEVKTWKDQNASLLFALVLEKYTMGFILMLIVLVAAFSISGTLMMTVFHKRTQISILRAVGCSKLMIYRIFLLQGTMIGLVGMLLGATVGVTVCYLLDRFQFVKLPNGLYYMDVLPVKLIPGGYVLICVCALVLVICAAIYPARLASQQNPSLNLRYE